LLFFQKLFTLLFVMFNKLSATRLVIALALVTVGCVSFFFGKEAMPLFLICITFANLAFWDFTAFNRPIPRREFWSLVSFILLFVFTLTVAIFWLPKSSAADFDFVSRPVFVVSLWIILLCVLWRRWQKQKTSSQ